MDCFSIPASTSSGVDTAEEAVISSPFVCSSISAGNDVKKVRVVISLRGGNSLSVSICLNEGAQKKLNLDLQKDI